MSSHDLSDDWTRLASYVATIDASLGKWLDENHRVGLTEYRALSLIAAAPDKELRVNDLATQTGLNQSSVTRLIGRLENKGLARRDTCPADGRGIYAVITDKGQAVVTEVRSAHADRLAELLSAPPRGRSKGSELRRALRTVGQLIPK